MHGREGHDLLLGCFILACRRLEDRSHSTHVLILVASLAVGCSSMFLTRIAIREPNLSLHLALVLKAFWNTFCKLVHRPGFSAVATIVDVGVSVWSEQWQLKALSDHVSAPGWNCIRSIRFFLLLGLAEAARHQVGDSCATLPPT